MSRVEAVAATERLPWLPDEPRPQAARRRVPVAIWVSAAILVVALGGAWVGVKSIEQPGTTAIKPQTSATTVRLPEPLAPRPEVRIPPQPEVRLTPPPQVRPESPRVVRIVATPAPRKAEHEATAKSAKVEPAEHSTSPAPAVITPPPFVMPKPWNPRVVTGASGRLVQIGAFGSVHQAKRGWWFMVRDYPAMAHLPSVVRETRNSKGRAFYRFDVGTTSQAHSEVLCQRMQKIRLSCAVVGLPWKAKVER